MPWATGRREKINTLLFITALLILIVAAVRIWLPYGVKGYVNGALRDIPGYTGSVGDIDIALLRGAYVIQDLDLRRVDATSDIPLLSIDNADISIEWKALFHGRIVSEIVLTRPGFHYVFEDHREPQAPTPETVSWLDAVKDLVPIAINHLEIVDGKIAFQQISSDPKIDVNLDQLNLVATNLRNVDSSDGELNSTVHASAVSIGDGAITIDGDMNLLRTIPDIDISLALDNASAPAFNQLISHYAGVAFKRGTISVYSELAIADGYLVGYIKPVLDEIEILDQDQGLISTLWESIVGFLSLLLENPTTDAIATKVPFEGDLNNPDTDVLAGIGNILKNAWLEAFKKTIDNDVDIDDAKTAGEQN